MFNQRLVHIDLKGAAPKIDYLIKLLPILEKSGCTGLLIEYEDTFPYEGSLKVLRDKNHYSEDDLRKLFEACIVNKLIVVPLIQSLGHSEFILKHIKFASLREIAEFPNVLCPTNGETLQLICNMIEQIVTLHTKYIDLNYIHLGCDECIFIANCQQCLNKCDQNHWSKEALFLDYVSKLGHIIQSNYSPIKSIIWDDMLRPKKCTFNLIEEFELNKNGIQLMVWHYLDMENFQLGEEQLWTKYLKSFDYIWIATAFKGASSVDQILPPIRFHINNHTAWLQIIKQFILTNTNYRQNLQGIAFTGWTRFDHMMTLCELLPTSIPSLVLCLQTIIKNGFNEGGEAHRSSSDILGFNVLIPLEQTSLYLTNHSFYANYQGSQLFDLTLRLVETKNDYKILFKHPSLKGAFTNYAIQNSRTNPLHIYSFLNNAKL